MPDLCTRRFASHIKRRKAAIVALEIDKDSVEAEDNATEHVYQLRRTPKSSLRSF